MKKNKWYLNIFVILFAFYCFFPIGFILLYLRLKEKMGKYKAINTLLIICGIGSILFGLIGVLALATSDGVKDLWVTLIFIIPGSICAYFGFKRKSKIDGYKKYLDYINVRNRIQLEPLCDKLNIDIDSAINILTEMINLEMINGYLTDEELILKRDDSNTEVIQSIEPVKKETKIVKCKECGAKNNVIIGFAKECEYCGTILQ